MFEADPHRVLFYEGSGYCFSNFSSFRVTWRDIDWDTSEHAYQAAKFMGVAEDVVELIRTARSAHDAKKIAREHEARRRTDWLKVRVPIMADIVAAKLSQHEYIQKTLRATEDRELIENSPKDAFWGRGPDWKGRNMLGRIWMRLRALLKAGTFVYPLQAAQ